MTDLTREAYLNRAADKISALFTAQGYTLPPVKISCSWPGGGSANSRIGECWPRAASTGGVNEIFISPTIGDSVRALDILTHELIHAIDDCQHGHRKEFTRIMRAVGLEGKPTATYAGERLHAELTEIVNALGKYPHDQLNLNTKKRQKNRQRKASCSDCGAVWRMSNSWLDRACICPVCQSPDISKD